MTQLPSEFTYLDCSVWQGDGKALTLQRPFAIHCGRFVLLCEFSGTRPVELLKEGPAAEIEPINRLLTALAGPMRFDVSVREIRQIERSSTRGVYLFLPEMHLPLVTKLPDVDPNLVPDPNKATCTCHGPVITRMLYGSTNGPARYRAVSAPLSRNPNDWFYWLAESHRVVAEDLIKLLDRLSKYSGHEPLHLIQLGALCEVWQGYRCVLQSMGRAAVVVPTVIDDLAAEELLAEWNDKTIGNKSKDATERFVKWQRKGAVLLHSAGQTHLENAGSFVAEVRHELIQREPPSAFLALREQKARLTPPRSSAPEGFAFYAMMRGLQRIRSVNASLYVTSGAPEPLFSGLQTSAFVELFGNSRVVATESRIDLSASALSP